MHRLKCFFFIFIMFVKTITLFSQEDQTGDKIKREDKSEQKQIKDVMQLLDEAKGHYSEKEFYKALITLDIAKSLIKADAVNIKFENVKNLNEIIKNLNNNIGKRIKLKLQYLGKSSDKSFTALHLESLNVLECNFNPQSESLMKVINSLSYKSFYLVMGKVNVGQNGKLLLELEKIE